MRPQAGGEPPQRARPTSITLLDKLRKRKHGIRQNAYDRLVRLYGR